MLLSINNCFSLKINALLAHALIVKSEKRLWSYYYCDDLPKIFGNRDMYFCSTILFWKCLSVHSADSKVRLNTRQS